MKFWDSSAIVPLLVEEPSTNALLNVYRQDSVMLAWWATEVECASALARLERAGCLTLSAATEALKRLHELRLAWQEVQPIDALRDIAGRLLRVHTMRAADALQLAAALLVCENRPSSLEFVCLDDRLSNAAQREGFNLISV